MISRLYEILCFPRGLQILQGKSVEALNCIGVSFDWVVSPVRNNLTTAVTASKFYWA